MITIFMMFLVVVAVFGTISLLVVWILTLSEGQKEKSGPKFSLKDKMALKQMWENFAKDPKSKDAQKLKMISFLCCLALGFIITGGAAFFTFLFGVVGMFLPQILLTRAEAKRLGLIDKQLSDGLVLIANSLRSGLSFAQGLEVLAQEGQPPLSEEFKIVTRELRLGVPMEQALNNLSERLVKSKEMKIAMTAINIARETGGNMAEALSTLSITMRKRNEMQGRIDGLTAQGKLSGLITSMLPFILTFFIFIIDPEMIKPMFTTLPGYGMILLALIMIGLGAVIIKKIITIDI